MTPIPAHLIKAFASVDQREIAAWWERLDEPHRAEVARLCDKRADSCFFGIVSDESELPEVRGGYGEEEEEIKPVEEWRLDYFDHLLAHPELVFIWDQNVRTFHTGCTAHSDALACWQQCAVPAAFKCPFERGQCLMTPLKGRTLRRLRPSGNRLQISSSSPSAISPGPNPIATQ